MNKLLISLILLFASPTFAALSASTVWEMRSAGSNNNGGGYVTGGGGTDFSQQDAAEDSGTDLACADGDAVAPEITSATHNFVAADVGNIINITEAGDGFTLGRYEIVSVAANAATLDRACGTNGAKTGGDWYLGGAVGVLTDAFAETVVAGNTIWVKADAEYTFTESTSQAVNGTSALPIYWKGYKTTRGESCTGTDRPLWTLGANGVFFGAYAYVENLRATSTAAYVFRIGTNSRIENCDVVNSSESANQVGIYGSASGTVIRCSSKSTNGYAVKALSNMRIMYCYLYDSTIGIYSTNVGGVLAVNNHIKNCTTGITLPSSSYYLWNVIGNTINSCTTGITGDVILSIFINNLFNDCTTEADYTNPQPTNFWDYNLWESSSTHTNVTIGPHAVETDVTLNADGSLQSGSAAIGVGMRIDGEIISGADYKTNIGADQDDNAAGGGGQPIIGGGIVR